MTFVFQNKNAFLTFAQCPIEKADALQHFQDKFPTLVEYIVAEESHADGGRHLHCFLQFQPRFNSREVTVFDMVRDGVTYHPNIARPRSVAAVIKYVQKDGDFIASLGIDVLLKKKSWGQIRAEATSTVEYLASVGEHYPRDFALNYERLRVFAEIIFPDPLPVYESPYPRDSFNVPPELNDWVDENVAMPQRNPMVPFLPDLTPRSIVPSPYSLWGQPGWGRPSGLDLLADTCTWLGCSTLTNGQATPSTLSSMTSNGNGYQPRNNYWGANMSSSLATSTVESVQSDLDYLSFTR